MTDYVINGGVIPTYPLRHYGAHFIGNRATFCLDADFAGLSSNVLAIPNLPITVLSASPVMVSEEFFGMHVQKRANDTLAGVTAKTIRSHDCGLRWNQIETSAGNFTWTAMDSWVNSHYALGRQLLFVLYGTPVFYSARPAEVGAYGVGSPGIQAEPSDMTKWDNFCSAVATRYLGKIKYYEVWNEPNMNNDGTTTSGSSFFFSGTFAKLSEMTRRANQAIKAIDPTAKILSPAVTNWSVTAAQSAEKFFTGMMAASDGAGGTMVAWIDIVGVHLYLPTQNRVEDLAGMIDRVNAAKTTAGISALPTWDTESAPIGGDVINLTDAQAMQLISRSMLTMAAKGVARTFYYQYDHGTMGFIARPQIEAHRERMTALLRSGAIKTVSRFTDGRVAYYTDFGLTII